MVKKGTKKPRKLVTSDRFPLIDGELRKRTKADLIAMILAIAKEHAVVAQELEDWLHIEKPMELLVADLSSAIERATDFDRRMINHNFEVDWRAYVDVRKGLLLLVEQGRLEEAKLMALQLMNRGSYQVECSDEGMMLDDLCECLKPVIQAVKTAGGVEATQWACDMLKADRIKFICKQELAELRGPS